MSNHNYDEYGRVIIHGTPQELFDKVVAGLRAQGSKSVDRERRCNEFTETAELVDVCKYRSKDGKKCAAGILIPDDLYQPNFEGTVVDGVAKFESDDAELLVRDLQYTHDKHEMFEWEGKFKSVAETFGLTYTPPEVKS
jgi:hypothetical protein